MPRITRRSCRCPSNRFDKKQSHVLSIVVAMCWFRDIEMESDHDRHSVITEVAHEAKDAFWDRQKVPNISFHSKIAHISHVIDVSARQGLFHEDIRAITLTLFLLWSVTNLVYYGTIFGIEVRT